LSFNSLINFNQKGVPKLDIPNWKIKFGWSTNTSESFHRAGTTDQSQKVAVVPIIYSRFVDIALILKQYQFFVCSKKLSFEPGRGEVKVRMNSSWIHSFCVAKQDEMGVLDNLGN